MGSERKKAGSENKRLWIRDGYLYKGEGELAEKVGRAITVSKYVTNVDTDEVSIVVEFEDNGKVVRKVISRGDLTPQKLVKLTDYGADCWKENAADYVSYLRDQIRDFPRSFSHSHVGWGTHQGNRVFKLHRGIGLDSEYVGGALDLRPRGTYEDWVCLVEEQVVGNPWLEFALVAGFTAPVLGLLAERAQMDSLFFNFRGPTSTGKTAATRVAISPWGLPDWHGNGLMKLWYGTDQGILSDLEGNFGVPVAIDDASHQESDKNFTQFIYQVAAGKGKRALFPDGTQRPQGEWMTTVFSSSEESMLKHADKKGGIRARFFEISVPYWTSSAENAEAIEQGTMQNCDHAGYRFVEHLMARDVNELFAMWEATKGYLLRYMKRDSMAKRIVGKLALVLLTGKLVRGALKLDVDMEVLTRTLLALEKQSFKSRNIGEEAYRHLLDYFVTNRSRFFKDGDKKSFRKGYTVGKYVERGGQVTEIRMPTSGFERVMSAGKFDTDYVLRVWKEKGILIHDKGKNYLERVFEPGMPRTPQYVVKVVDMPGDEDGGAKKLFEEEPVTYEVLSEDGEIVKREVRVHLTPLDDAYDVVEKIMNAEWYQELEGLENDIIAELVDEGLPLTLENVQRRLSGLDEDEASDAGDESFDIVEDEEPAMEAEDAEQPGADADDGEAEDAELATGEEDPS